MLFRGGGGVGSRGPVISLLLPRYHPELSGGQGSLYVNASLPGSPGSGVRRRQRHQGTGFWGTNPRRNSLRGPTCVQGGKKKKYLPCTWENTPHVGKKTSTFPHTEDWCPSGGQKHPPVFKGPGPEKRTGFSAWENLHPSEESHVHLTLLVHDV